MATHLASDSGASAQPQDYQDRDINITSIVVALIVIVVVTISAAIGMLALHRTYASAYEEAREQAPDLVKVREIPPGPKLQVNGQAELEEYQAAIQSQLESYEFTDKMRGVGRIPVERAMEILAERGLPSRDAP